MNGEDQTSCRAGGAAMMTSQKVRELGLGAIVSTISPPNPSPVSMRYTQTDLGQGNEFIPTPIGAITQRLKVVITRDYTNNSGRTL